jgi:hypothetical protein
MDLEDTGREDSNGRQSLASDQFDAFLLEL